MRRAEGTALRAQRSILKAPEGEKSFFFFSSFPFSSEKELASESAQPGGG